MRLYDLNTGDKVKDFRLTFDMSKPISERQLSTLEIFKSNLIIQVKQKCVECIDLLTGNV